MTNVIVVKRDGKEVPYNREKIICAINKALLEMDGNLNSDYISKNVAISIENYFAAHSVECITVEEIQDLVEWNLINGPRADLAKSYIRYRYKKEMARNRYKDLMDTIGEKLSASNVQNQNANVDEHSFGGRMGEMNGAVARMYALDHVVSHMAKENHLNNMIYIHDLDHYAVGSHNCLSIPFDDLLANGFNTRQTDVRPAQSVSTAFQLVAVIFQLQSLQQFGGVSATHIDWTMVPYVRKSFAKHYRDAILFFDYHGDEEAFNAWMEEKESYLNGLQNELGRRMTVEEVPIDSSCIRDNTKFPSSEERYAYALKMTEREVYQAVEAMYHNLNTLQSRSGNQLKYRLAG